jgi:parallel beta-helix repeat protein
VRTNGNYKLHGSGIIVDWGTATVRVENNVIYGNSGFGIDVYEQPNTEVYNNTVYLNGKFPAEHAEKACSSNNPSPNQGCYYQPDYVNGEIRNGGSGSRNYNNVYLNNIVYADRMVAFADHVTGNDDYVTDHNLLFRLGDDRVVRHDYGTLLTLEQYRARTGNGLHSLNADPLFVSQQNYDFHLQPGSPAIDAGTDVGLPYSGAAPDMGAFEYR